MANNPLDQLRKALAEKLRQMGMDADKAEVKIPQELLEKLGAVGLQVHTGEVSGMKVISLGQTEPEERGPTLEDYLSRMNADQTKIVARRYNPRVSIKGIESARQAILEALSKPAVLGAMVEQLNPMELELLQLTKQAGGEISGWDLIIHAALRKFAQPRLNTSGSWYKMHYAKSEGMGYLSTLLRDGLLLPISFAAPWFDSYGFSRNPPSPDDAFVAVDPRVLEHIPDLEQSPSFPQLNLPAVSAQPTAPHPVRALIELHETLKLVLEEGQLQVTREGRIARQSLNKMAKKRPWLEGLETSLGVMVSNGMVQPGPDSKDQWKPVPQLFQKLASAPLPMQYWTLVMGFLDSHEAPEASWQTSPEGVYSVEVGRQALLEGLHLLPQHPVGLEALLNALWERVLQFVGERRSSYYYSTERKKSLPPWYRKTLLGDFHRLGLVALVGLDKTNHAIARGLGLEWFKQGKQLGQQLIKLPTDPSESSPPNPELQAQTLEALGMDPQTRQSLERPLLVQPNFEVLVYLDKLNTFALAALACADCTRIDAQTASYTISRSSVYRALESGLTIDWLLEMLQLHSTTPIPAALTTSLREWAERRERLSVQENTRLLEYPSAAERDAALAQTKGKAIGERFVLASGATRLPKEVVRHSYTNVPARSLRFEPDGRFRIKGASDLAARAIIASLAERNPNGSYSFNRDAIRQRRFDAVREEFLARVDGGLPQQLEALMGIWAAKTPEPIIAKVSLFQHPNAAALAKHPELAKHLDSPISDTTFVVRVGQENELESSLITLGIVPSHQLKTNLKAQAIQGNILQTGLPTRKIREMAEAAIRDKRGLELKYHKEKVSYNRYGYPSSEKGKLVSEKIDPDHVSYDGSTPYLEGRTQEEGEPRRIRLGYVQGIAVL